MEQELIKKIDALRVHLTSSAPVKLNEVVETWNKFCEAIGKPQMKKASTGCISCVRNMLTTMCSHIDKIKPTNDDAKAPSTHASKEDSAVQPPKKKGGNKKNR